MARYVTMAAIMVFPNPYPTLLFLVIDHTSTHPNQLKLASYDFFHRWTLGWDTMCRVWSLIVVLGDGI